MAIKFIVCGDLHWRGSNPRARKDDYMMALKLKLEEVFHLAIDHKAPVIIPGDIFNSPNTAWHVVAELIRAINVFMERSDLPIITIPGNHDIFGSNLESVSRTPYGLMSLIGVIDDIDCGTMAWAGLDKGMDGASPWVMLSGHGYNACTDTPGGTYQFYTPGSKFAIAKIHIVHANLMLDPPGHDMRHTLVDEVKTDADVIISGHYHPGLGRGEVIYRRPDGVLFINPGALARTAATASDLTRQVGVVLLEVHEDGRCGAEWIPLESARPGEEVLSREHLEAIEEREGRIQDFLELLAEEGQARFLEMSEIIEDIAERDRLPAEVKAEALRRLSEAREALGVR